MYISRSILLCIFVRLRCLVGKRLENSNFEMVSRSHTKNGQLCITNNKVNTKTMFMNIDDLNNFDILIFYRQSLII